jgi:6-phosphogluconolactonase
MEASLSEKIHVLSDYEALSHRAALFFIEVSKSAINARGRFFIAVSGGSTPKKLFALLGTLYRNEIQWKHVHFFWVDERCVPKEHAENNYKTAYDALISKVSIPEKNIHRIRGENDPDHEALRYEGELKNSFGKSVFPFFDLIILGMGEDGHTASLFPGLESIDETKRLAIPVYVERLRSQRITLTLHVLNNAKQVLFLVSGSSKAHVIADILKNTARKTMYPAGLVNPVNGDVTWLVDEEAAMLLKTRNS